MRGAKEYSESLKQRLMIGGRIPILCGVFDNIGVAVTNQDQNSLSRVYKRYLLRGLWLEFVLIVAVSVLVALIAPMIGFSVFLGGAVYAVPHTVFTLMGLRHIGDSHSAGLLVSVVTGFIGKLVFMGGGLALVFTHGQDFMALPTVMAMTGFYVTGLFVTGFLSSRAAQAVEEA